jgi:hypothetical protein
VATSIVIGLVFDRAVSWMVARKCPAAASASENREHIHLDRVLYASIPDHEGAIACAIDADASSEGRRFEVVHDLRVTCDDKELYNEATVLAHDGQIRARLSRQELSLRYLAAWTDDSGSNLVCLTNGVDNDRTNRVVLHRPEPISRLLEGAPTSCLELRAFEGDKDTR